MKFSADNKLCERLKGFTVFLDVRIMSEFGKLLSSSCVSIRYLYSFTLLTFAHSKSLLSHFFQFGHSNHFFLNLMIGASSFWIHDNLTGAEYKLIKKLIRESVSKKFQKAYWQFWLILCVLRHRGLLEYSSGICGIACWRSNYTNL